MPETSTTRWRRPTLPFGLIDGGWTIRYDGTPAVIHPRTDPSRHPDAAERTMRNRVWLAYRNLPAPLAAVYVANWFVISALRRPRSSARCSARCRDGWRTRPAGQRAPIAGAPSPSSPASAGHRSSGVEPTQGSVPTMTGAADGNDARSPPMSGLRSSPPTSGESMPCATAPSTASVSWSSPAPGRRAGSSASRRSVAAAQGTARPDTASPRSAPVTAPAGPHGRRRHDPRRVLAPGVRAGVGPTSADDGARRRPADGDRPRAALRRVGVGGQRRSVPLRPRPFRQAPRLAAARHARRRRRRPAIPTVFWNKEDPVHFDDFADAATQFDWIFTTDADCIDRYVEAGRPRAGRRPARSPPSRASTTRSARPASASPGPASPGAGRPTTTPTVAPTSSCCSVPSSTPGCSTSSTAWPLRVPPARGSPRRTTRPCSAPDRTPTCSTEYRRYACFLNVNSVKTSPTMCSRRVFELLACRTPVVSTPSRAIDELLGDAVITVETQADARDRRRAADRRRRAPRPCRPARLPRRDVAAHLRPPRRPDPRHARHRHRRRQPPKVTVLAPTNRPEFLDRLLDNFARQRDVDRRAHRAHQLGSLRPCRRRPATRGDRRRPGDPPRRGHDDGRVPQRRSRRDRRPVRRQVRRRRPLRRRTTCTTRCSSIATSTPRSSARRRSSPTSRDPTRRSCASPATSSRPPTG